MDSTAGFSVTVHGNTKYWPPTCNSPDIKRDFSYETLADDMAVLLDYLKIPNADLIGYSMGGGVAMQCAIRHPEKVRKVVSISAVIRRDGLVKEALDAFPQLTSDTFKGSPIETEYKKLSPTPDAFPNFVKRVVTMALKPYDFGAGRLNATTARCFSSTAMPTAYDSNTSRKCPA